MRKTGIDSAVLREHAEEASRLLKTIGNPTRLMILCTLVQGEFAVGELNDQIGLSQSTLSQHLSILRREGFVRTRREAQTIYYSLQSDEAGSLMKCLYKIYCH